MLNERILKEIVIDTRFGPKDWLSRGEGTCFKNKMESID